MKKILWFVIGATLAVTHIGCLGCGMLWGAWAEHETGVWGRTFGEES